ncbi:MAG: BamA/OMP85 family outer membrane protein [Candidatus Sericytochromatia bacterium]
MHRTLSISLLSFTLLVSALPLQAAEPVETYRLENADPLTPQLIKVKRLTVIGTRFEDSVRLAMRTHAGDEVTPEMLREDQQRIAALGFFADVTPRLIPVSDGYELVIYLRENPQLTRVEVLGEPELLSREELAAAFADQPGDVLNYADIERIRAQLENRLRAQGYALAHLEFVNDGQTPLQPDGSLQVRLHPGRIESIEVAGLERTEAQVITRELSLRPGQIFEREAFERDLDRVRRLGFFSSVDARPEKGADPHQFKLVLDVKEQPTRDVGLNFGLNNRDGLVGGVHFTDPNFLGQGRYLNLKVQAGLDVLGLIGGNAQQSQRSFSGRVDFYDAWLLPDHTGFGASVFSERTPLFFGTQVAQLPFDVDGGVLQTRSGTTLSLGRPLGDISSPLHGSLSLTAEQVELSAFDRTPRRDLSLSKRFSATDVLFNVAGGVTLDTRNQLHNPTRGVFGSLSAQPVWGDGNYLRLAGQFNTYIPLVPDWLTLAVGLQGGTFLGAHPVYEQFYGSGPSSIRGWQENGTLFGSGYLIGSAEARFPIWSVISGVLFTDVGNFFPDLLSASNQGLPFKYGVGTGLRLDTPMGLLRLDYGIRNFGTFGWESLLDAGQLHFSIGHKF